MRPAPIECFNSISTACLRQRLAHACSQNYKPVGSSSSSPVCIEQYLGLACVLAVQDSLCCMSFMLLCEHARMFERANAAVRLLLKTVCVNAFAPCLLAIQWQPSYKLGSNTACRCMHGMHKLAAIQHIRSWFAMPPLVSPCLQLWALQHQITCCCCP